jgi:adenine-specific DNA-methyltransferase
MPILQWLNKDEAVTTAKNCDYRLLEEVPELSYGDENSENLLIQGDNLEALKALIPFYAGKIKCIYIDPPYNTKSAFNHYDDNLEHSKWLTLIYPRLEILRELLSGDGSIWVSIDDSEAHYLKVILDEVFGRRNFVHSMVWQQRTTRENRKVFSNNHEYVHLYAKDIKQFSQSRNALELTGDVKNRYKNPDNDPRGDWQSVSANAQAGHATSQQFYELIAPNGKTHNPPSGRCWLYTEKRMKEEILKNNIWFGRTGDGVPRIKKFFKDVTSGLTPETLWLAEDVGTNDSAKKHTISLFEKMSVFDTPKPESLIKQIIQIATNEKDIVLDSFLGSGTTAAVAHKMSRRYIGIELGEHAKTHCQLRLQKVVDGEQGGISKAINWQGGGGFKFVKLGQTVFDEYGCLNPEIKFSTFAAHIWYLETKQPLAKKKRSAFLGTKEGTAYYLLYNGILGDKRPDGGNVLTSKVLKSLPKIEEQLSQGLKIVIYGESTRLGEARLKQSNISFKQIPYDVAAL